VQRLASCDRSRVDLQAVASRPDAAGEAPAEGGIAGADVASCRCSGHGERHRRRELEVERGRAGLGDERLAVEEPHVVGLAANLEPPVERRRPAQRDLDRVRSDELGQPTAGVAPVRRVDGPTEATRQHELHGRTLVRLGFVTVRRKL